MPRRVAAISLFCAICIFAVGMASQPNRTRSREGTRSYTEEQKFVFASEHEQAADAHSTESSSDPPLWYASPEWWLAILGILTVPVLIYQAIEMRKATDEMAKSAKAAEKSIELQEVALRQWVAIENWDSLGVYISEDGVHSFQLQFDVVNPSNLPLTLNNVFIMFACHGCSNQEVKVGRKNLIPPHKGHPVVATVRITEEQELKWEDLKEVAFFINGHVVFEDALKEIRSQPINGTVLFSKKAKVKFIPFYGAGPYSTRPQKDDEKAN